MDAQAIEARMKAWSQVKHFKPAEFDSPDRPGSGLEFMNLEFVLLLDQIREKVKFPLRITSGYRTIEHNMKVGGVSGSAHVNGVAVDITVENGRERWELVCAAQELGIKRAGVGPSFVHIDLDYSLPQNVMWTYPV